MNDPFGPARRIGWLLLIALALVVCRVPPYYDLSRQPLGQIPPGTVIGERAPAGWTHLIVKSQPRIREQDLPLLERRDVELASLFFTAVVARVAVVSDSNPPRYRLDDAAVGFGTPIDGRDTIVTPATVYQLKAPIGLAGRIVLRACVAEMSNCRWAARSDTFGLIDTPATMLREGQHRAVVLRYALLIDPERGTLDAVVWRIDRDAAGKYQAPPGEAHWLPPDKQVDCTLAFDSQQTLLGIPAHSAFAIEAVPQGRLQWPLPTSLAPIAAREHLSGRDAAELESELRRMLDLRSRQQVPARVR